MIYLITGLPGNGKTLYTLWHLRDRAAKENRPVFISGVPDLAIDGWNEIDESQAQRWFELPDGAIIVIDEAQRIFRPRAGRGDPPAHVAQLETHRHKGYDIYLITQHPALIDQNVRRLAGIHRHVQRTFGMQRATIHEWGEVHLDCERRRADSSKTVWKFPKDVYKLYKSAEVHTHKVHMPKQVWYLLGCLAVLAFCLAFVYLRTGSRLKTVEPPTAVPGSVVEPPRERNGLIDAGFSRPAEKPPMTREEYVASLAPRIAGFPHTSPRYDEVTKPVEAPYPAACVRMAEKCLCYSQQATLMNVDAPTCQTIVERGFFIDWEQRERQDSRQWAEKRQDEGVRTAGTTELHQGGLIANSGSYGGVR